MLSDLPENTSVRAWGPYCWAGAGLCVHGRTWIPGGSMANCHSMVRNPECQLYGKELARHGEGSPPATVGAQSPMVSPSLLLCSTSPALGAQPAFIPMLAWLISE